MRTRAIKINKFVVSRSTVTDCIATIKLIIVYNNRELSRFLEYVTFIEAIHASFCSRHQDLYVEISPKDNCVNNR